MTFPPPPAAGAGAGAAGIEMTGGGGGAGMGGNGASVGTGATCAVTVVLFAPETLRTTVLTFPAMGVGMTTDFTGATVGTGGSVGSGVSVGSGSAEKFGAVIAPGDCEMVSAGTEFALAVSSYRASAPHPLNSAPILATPIMNFAGRPSLFGLRFFVVGLVVIVFIFSIVVISAVVIVAVVIVAGV